MNTMKRITFYVASSLFALAILVFNTESFPDLYINAAPATDYPDGDIVTNPWNGTTHHVEPSSDVELSTKDTTSSEVPSSEVSSTAEAGTVAPESGTSTPESSTKDVASSEVPSSEVSSTAQTGTVTKPGTTKKPSVKNGTKFVVKKYSARFVIKNSKKRTVQYLKSTNARRKKAIIPATVKYKGKTYKVTSIACNCFKNHKKLSSVTIGSNVSVINKNAFLNCKKLKKITIKSTALKKVGKKAFKGINARARIKVPKKKLKAYKKLLKNKGLGKKVKIVK